MTSENRSLLAGLITYALWGTPPIVSVYLVGDLDNLQITFWIHVFAVISSLAFCLIRGQLFQKIQSGISLVALPPLVGSGLSQAAMYLCFHYAVQTGGAVEATIIHNVWPIILIIMSSAAFSKEGDRLSVYQIFLSVFAFGGAAILLTNRFGTPGSDVTINVLFAFVSAVFAALNAYFNKLGVQRIQRINDKPLEVSDHAYVFLIRVTVPTLFLFLYAISIERSVFTVKLDGLVWAAFLGVVTYFMAGLLFSYALAQVKTINLAVASYVSPIVSLVLLYVIFGKFAGATSLVGAAIVLLAVYQLQNHIKFLSAESGGPVAILLLAVALLFVRPVTNANELFPMAELSGGIFAIILGFTLVRLHERNKEQSSYFSDIGRELSELCQLALQYGTTRGVRDQLKLVSAEMIDVELSPTMRKAMREVPHIIEAFGVLKNLFREHFPSEIIESRFAEIEKQTEKWILLRTDRLSIAERWGVFLLGAVIVAGVVLCRPPGLVGDFTALGVSIVIIILCLAMRDLDFDKLGADYFRLETRQYSFLPVLRATYFPKELLDAGQIPLPEKETQVLTRTVKGEFVKTMVVRTQFSQVTGVIIFLVAVGAALASFALA